MPRAELPTVSANIPRLRVVMITRRMPRTLAVGFSNNAAKLMVATLHRKGRARQAGTVALLTLLPATVPNAR